MNQKRVIPYLISQYLWVIILATFLTIPFMITHKNETGKIYSKTDYEKFDRSKIPFVFSHLSDVHINHNIQRYTDNLIKAVSILEKIQPDLNINTGDLADNFKGAETIPKYGVQQQEDFEIYMKIMENITNRIEVDGNHDCFGLYSYGSKMKTNESQSYEDYLVSVYRRDDQNLTFVALNPYNFPTPHPPLLYYAQPSKEMLDIFEKALQSIPENHIIIILDHFPYDHFKYSSKSSNGKTFHDILHGDNRIGYFLDGHLHPSLPYVLHRKNDILEICGTDLKDNHRFAIGVFDNGRFTYHSININEPDPVLSFITNPPTDSYYTSHQVFNELENVLRVIVYKEETPKIHVEGVINTDLICNKPNEAKFWLCEADLNLTEKDKKYSLTLSGDLNQTLDFTIADSIDGFTEGMFHVLTSFVDGYYVQLAFVWLFLLIIILPYPLPEVLKNDYKHWSSGLTNKSMWVFSIFAGFLAVKIRIERLPHLIRYSLLVAVLWPFLLPIHFMTIEGHLSVIWAWGFICEKPYYDLWGQILTLLYLSCILLPVTVFSSALAVSSPISWTFIIDAIPPIGTILIDIYIGLRWGNEASGMLGGIFSPAFTLAPLYLYTLLLVWRFRWKKGLIVESLIPSTALLDNQ